MDKLQDYKLKKISPDLSYCTGCVFNETESCRHPDKFDIDYQNQCGNVTEDNYIWVKTLKSILIKL